MKLLVTALLLAAGMGHAQDALTYRVIHGSDSAATTRAYWTPDRIANAKPIQPEADIIPGALIPEDETLPIGATPFSAPGGQPLVKLERDSRLDESIQEKIREILKQNAQATPQSGTSAPTPIPLAVGTSGLQFTSTRLIPITADTEYPYHAAGKLLFTVPGGGQASCTASVVNFRLLLTAGHCVNDGSGNTFQNFMFTPSYRNGAAPFGTWTWANAGYVPLTWLNGGGAVPNAADYAILVMADGVPGAGGTPPRLGGVTGWLGVVTYATRPNDLFILGYPSNLDGGQMMHQVNSGSYTSGGSNTVRYGGDMRQGASGGPWIQNFGAAATGQVGGATNQVVAVTSYVANSLTPLYEGASIFDNRFQDIYQAACAQAAGNCN